MNYFCNYLLLMSIAGSIRIQLNIREYLVSCLIQSNCMQSYEIYRAGNGKGKIRRLPVPNGGGSVNNIIRASDIFNWKVTFGYLRGFSKLCSPKVLLHSQVPVIRKLASMYRGG